MNTMLSFHFESAGDVRESVTGDAFVDSDGVINASIGIGRDRIFFADSASITAFVEALVKLGLEVRALEAQRSIFQITSASGATEWTPSMDGAA